ncbi:fimbrillin family protein [Alistipes sp. OttesenSCG-928-L06]|nr:fimbrillin family protein [Alistipes sp. OttesenSCG-928-L06]
MSSCSNNEEVNKTPGNGDEIGFRTIIDKGSETRAAITTTSNIRNFTVTGWWDNPDNGTGGLAELDDVQPSAYLFNGADISRREAAISDWEYAPKKYWPAGGSVYFFAYSPAASKNIAPNKGIANYVSPSSSASETDKTYLTYTVPNPSDDDGQEDFLLAYTGGIYNTTVGLHFVHALSRVRFAARKTNNHITYNIKQIRLLSLYKGANIDMEKIPTDGVLNYTTPPLVVWDNHATLGSKEDITIDAGETPAYVEYSTTHYSSLQGLAAAMMVMPQTTTLGADPKNPLAGEFYIEVIYEAFIPGALPNGGDLYYTGDGTGIGDNRFDTRLFAVKAPGSDPATPLTFEMGRQYNFLLTFGDDAGDPIDFAVDVSTWNDDAPVVELPQLDDYTPFLSAKIADQIKARTGNPKVSLNDIFKTTELKIDNVAQADLLGLELFSQLTRLALDNTAAGLELDLKGLDNIGDLSLHRGANLAKLDISGIKKFMYINCPWYTMANPNVAIADNYITIGEMIVWDGFQHTISSDSDKKIYISAYSGDTNEHAGVKIPSVKQVNGNAATTAKIWLGYKGGGSTTDYETYHYIYK